MEGRSAVEVVPSCGGDGTLQADQGSPQDGGVGVEQGPGQEGEGHGRKRWRKKRSHPGLAR